MSERWKEARKEMRPERPKKPKINKQEIAGEVSSSTAMHLVDHGFTPYDLEVFAQGMLAAVKASNDVFRELGMEKQIHQEKRDLDSQNFPPEKIAKLREAVEKAKTAMKTTTKLKFDGEE